MLFALLIFAIQTAQEPAGFRDFLRAGTAEVGRARQAIVDFERSRRNLLPRGSGGGGQCDERIGRFCYWYDEADTTLPMEPPPIRLSRTRLLETLAAAQPEQPGNDWLVGQWVRYLIEQGATDSATSVAARCQATRWWCHALQGLAWHAAARFDQADAAFRLAVDSMPAGWACRWTDWRGALSTEQSDRLAGLPCDQRPAAIDSLFWLAKPLLSKPGNDLRTEFHSRRVMAMLQAASTSPHLNPWGGDLEEMMIRYGWSTHWSAVEPRMSGTDGPSVVGHQRVPAYGFFPTWSSADSGWRWDQATARPRSRYGPGYLDHLEPTARFQIARFPRGDSTMVVAGMTVATASDWVGGSFDIWLAGSERPGTPVAIATRSAPTLGPVTLTMAGVPALVSLEAGRPQSRRFARARAWFRPVPHTGGLVLSDPLLFRAADELPSNLEGAVAKALTSTTVSRRQPVGVYWEASGPGADSVDVSVAVVPIRRGLLGRLGQRLRLVKRPAPVTLQWRTGGETLPVVGRAFELDLRRLASGRYYLRLEATTRGRTASTGRSFELTS